MNLLSQGSRRVENRAVPPFCLQAFGAEISLEGNVTSMSQEDSLYVNSIAQRDIKLLG